MRRVQDFVDANVDQTLTIETLAEVVCLSHFHFARMFKETIGDTPHQYVTARRIARAKTLIEGAGDLPLSEIAATCGFSQQSHFGRVFKAATGLTPNAFRKAMTS
ncbi:MAG: AraC family transcriptional regulator [Pseudomonadota bacterium]